MLGLVTVRLSGHYLPLGTIAWGLGLFYLFSKLEFLGRNDGISAWPAIVALAESPRQAGVYYAGTDDGTLSVSRDGGKSWQNITSKVPGFPTGGFVSGVVPWR